MSVRAVIFDMDGVIRHWRLRDIDEQAGVPAGTLVKLALGLPSFEKTQTGDVSHDEWVDDVRAHIIAEHGPQVADAVNTWRDYRGDIDDEIVDIVRAVRGQAVVALLSNATDRLRDDLAHHGLGDAFEYIFCSAEIGMAKPDTACFDHAAREIGVPIGQCLFVDDQKENVEGARSAGMQAEVFTTADDLRALLKQHGIEA